MADPRATLPVSSENTGIQLASLLTNMSGTTTKTTDAPASWAVDNSQGVYSAAMARSTDPQNAVVDNILQQSAIQFAPTLSQGLGASGLYNSSTVQMLQDNARGSAVAQSSAAVLQAQQSALQTAAQISNSQMQTSKTSTAVSKPNIAQMLQSALPGVLLGTIAQKAGAGMMDKATKALMEAMGMGEGTVSGVGTASSSTAVASLGSQTGSAGIGVGTSTPTLGVPLSDGATASFGGGALDSAAFAGYTSPFATATGVGAGAPVGDAIAGSIATDGSLIASADAAAAGGVAGADIITGGAVDAAGTAAVDAAGTTALDAATVAGDSMGFWDSAATAVTAALEACYITTACCVAKDLPDDCDELTTLRAFRDGWLQENHPEDIELYYRTAPDIVDRVSQRSDALAIFRGFYHDYIVPAVRDVQNGENSSAYAVYKALYEKAAELAAEVV